MYVIIVGGGKVGFHLARELVEDGHEVLVIEENQAIVTRINSDLGDIAIEGDGCEVAVMEQAGMARADMVIAVTGDDEDNLVVCQVAKKRFNVPRTVARINDPRNEDIFKVLGIDVTVSATAAIMAQIEEELPSHRLIHLLTLRGSDLEIVDIEIPDNAAVVGRKVKELLLPHQTIMVLIYDRDGVPRVPTGETTVRGGDEIVLVTRKESETALRSALTAPAVATRFNR
jgi:trk system potassium uptake protein TrkA